MTNFSQTEYVQALNAYKAEAAHELKDVGDQWRTPDPLFWGINAMFGPLVLDLFSDGENSKCEAYYTAEDNALAQNWSAGLIAVLHERYDGKGKSKMVMAADLQKRHPEMSIMTCRRRIDIWSSFPESMLYRPMCDAFDTNSERFHLKCEQGTA